MAGFILDLSQGSADHDGKLETFSVDAGHTTILAPGDVIRLTGTADAATGVAGADAAAQAQSITGIIAGIEPIFAAAYKRRFLKDGKNWRYQYVVEQIAREFSDLYGADPDDIDCALSLASNPEQRIKLQAEVQAYVDMAISSTINLPAFNTKHNNPDKVKDFAEVLAKYAHRLRGFTCFPDGSRGGQPLTPVPYKDAVDKLGKDFEEHVEAADICSITGHGGTCGG